MSGLSESLKDTTYLTEEDKRLMDETSDTRGNLNDNVPSNETEIETNNISLTPAEEEEFKSLISLSDDNYCKEGVAIKTEMEDETIPDGITSEKSEGNNNTEECLKSESDLDDATCEYATEGTLEGPEAMSSDHENTPPMTDIQSPFYVDQTMVPIKYYEENLVRKIFNPLEVLYHICCQCNWPKPEFRMIETPDRNVIWHSVKSVKVNNHNIVCDKTDRKRKEAQHLASASFLKFLGLKFSYEPTTKSDRMSAIQSWSEKYTKFNSSSLTRENEKLGIRYSSSSRECDTDYKRKRSSSVESRSSNHSRTHRSPEKRRDNLKRDRRSEKSDEEEVRRRSRGSHPESSHRRSHLRMDQEEQSPHRRPKLRMDQEEQSSHRRPKLRLDQEEQSFHRRPKLRMDQEEQSSHRRSKLRMDQEEQSSHRRPKLRMDEEEQSSHRRSHLRMDQEERRRK